MTPSKGKSVNLELTSDTPSTGHLSKHHQISPLSVQHQADSGAGAWFETGCSWTCRGSTGELCVEPQTANKMCSWTPALQRMGFDSQSSELVSSMVLAMVFPMVLPKKPRCWVVVSCLLLCHSCTPGRQKYLSIHFFFSSAEPHPAEDSSIPEGNGCLNWLRQNLAFGSWGVQLQV